jgi:hypothetical protein
VTLEAPLAGDCDTCRNPDVDWSLYVIVRGIESPQQGVRVGDITLPREARMRSVRHTGTWAPMSFVSLAHVPTHFCQWRLRSHVTLARFDSIHNIDARSPFSVCACTSHHQLWLNTLNQNSLALEARAVDNNSWWDCSYFYYFFSTPVAHEQVRIVVK